MNVMNVWNIASEEGHINPDEKKLQKAGNKIMQKRYQSMTRIENASYRANGEAFFWQFSEKAKNMLTSGKNRILLYGTDNTMPSSFDDQCYCKMEEDTILKIVSGCPIKQDNQNLLYGVSNFSGADH